MNSQFFRGTIGSVLSGTTATNSAIIGMQQVGINTVALNIWDFTASTTSTAIAPNYNKYSSSDVQVQAAISYIQSKGMNVMLKPMLDLDNGTWRGEISPAAANVNALVHELQHVHRSLRDDRAEQFGGAFQHRLRIERHGTVFVQLDQHDQQRAQHLLGPDHLLRQLGGQTARGRGVTRMSPGGTSWITLASTRTSP